MLGASLSAAATPLAAESFHVSAHASPFYATTSQDAAQQSFVLDKKFKGKLPITQLTEEEAITHALNRLAYGARPGDEEQIKQIGLDKWIDQQLHPESIADADLDARLKRYPTLTMSSKQLIDAYPEANQVAKREGIPK